jgi:hypothetical protein
MNFGSLVSIVTRVCDGQLGFNSQWGLGFCLLATMSRPVLGPTQPPIHLVLRALTLGVKQPGCEADCLPPSSIKVKNALSYISTPAVCLNGVRLILSMGNFTISQPYSVSY